MYSNYKDVLINLGKLILDKYNLFKVKVPISNTPTSPNGFEFVLCIYDARPELKIK